ncbi:9969_t:CDS:2, partial [Racocetra fulgida]
VQEQVALDSQIKHRYLELTHRHLLLAALEQGRQLLRARAVLEALAFKIRQRQLLGTSTATPSPPPNGTANPSYTTTSEKDPAGTLNIFHSISAMPAYRNFSFEELRLQDYQLNRKPLATGSNFGGIGSVTPSFGATSTPSAFGAAPSGFGNAFGVKSTQPTQPFAFGGGATATPAAGGGFGAQVGSSQLFGASKPFGAPTGGGFGTATPGAGGGFGSAIGGI